MRVRQLSAAVATAALVVGAGLVMAAPPAAAASISVNCTGSGPGGTLTVTVTPGELIFYTVTSCGVDAPSYPLTDLSGQNALLVDSGANPGTYTGVGGFSGTESFDLDVIVVAAPAPIPDWVQAYGRFGMDATCLPGWGPSWQQWAVASTGGWVCTRSIPSLG